MPFKSALRTLEIRPDGLCEREGERLARCLALLGDAEPRNPANWNLNLTAAELALAASVVTERVGPDPYIVLCIGTKLAGRDWGDDHWRRLIGFLLDCYPHKLVFIGAASDRARSDSLARVRPERFVNLCGDLGVRVSAAVLKGAVLYIGHDSGPMHLASAVRTPLVAIFSNRDKPGKWFPIGDHVKILYPYDLNTTILSIDPRHVLESVLEIIPSASRRAALPVCDDAFHP
jgi:ADP-heptose:LPS heptosyltransferase